MKYYGGCDSGSTYTKCVILDETGKMVADVTLRSRINSVLSAQHWMRQWHRCRTLRVRRILLIW